MRSQPATAETLQKLAARFPEPPPRASSTATASPRTPPSRPQLAARLASDAAALELLRRIGPTTSAELAGALGIRPLTAASLVMRLHRAGVVRLLNDRDRLVNPNIPGVWEVVPDAVAPRLDDERARRTGIRFGKSEPGLVVPAAPGSGPRRLVVLPVTELAGRDSLFRCDALSASMRAAACVARQRDGRSQPCARGDCPTGKAVRARLAEVA
jgi:hypothetical protein